MRLLVAREVLTGEMKCFLVHAPREMTVREILVVARVSGAQGSGGAAGLDTAEVRHDSPLGTDGEKGRVPATSA